MNNNRQPAARRAVKVPVVMQMEALECGAASLAMILAYYGKWIPLEQLRVDCGVSRDGSNARNMLRAARGYGLKAQGFRYEQSEMLLEEGIFPCILHWNFNHFVVCCGFRGGYAIINDPARGTVKVPMEEFDRSFTGICLQFSPDEGFEPDGRRKSTLAFARQRLAGAGVAVAFVALCSTLANLFGLIDPAFSRFFMDRLLTGENIELLHPFIALFAGVSILRVIIAGLQEVYALRISGKLAAVGNSTYLWKVLRLPMEFFSQRMAGDIQIRQSSNASIATTLVGTFAPMLLDTGMMVFYLIVMLRFSPLLTFVGIAAIALSAVVSRLVSARRVDIMRVQMRDEGKLAAATVGGIQMAETIKAGGAEDGFFARWAGFQASVNAQEVRYARLDVGLGMIPAFLSAAAGDIVLVLGVYLAMRGEFTLGMILMFQSFLNSFMAPAITMISAGQTIQEMRTQMERIEDVMNYPDDPYVRESGQIQEGEAEKLSGSLSMEHVTFGYSRLDEPLIRDFSMHCEPGSRIALVGASGCGKSTIAKLLSGICRPWEGEITYDGRRIDQIDRSVFTGSVAVVDQDIILFEDTIAENIRMWDRSIEDFEMILAARDAQIHSDILRREGGYHGRLAEGGRDLSGGQRQRLEIARVLAQDPSVIIMDEATSALDAQTEHELVQAVVNRGITCIVIAHRLSTIRDCDEIIVLDHGRVVERGTHDELYAAGGAYADLVANE
ncbi:MAG: NHLP family bacteriocin export ABC transporter peptidase/permease/ATPase subunit [Lachnospiraceae bacterium]|nr:NHLP family bacteriocin export ABC transporter peptidase/permease/ATPase subunit [Lachnospiraceae bacterium]